MNYVINRRISHAIIEFWFGFRPFLPPTIAEIVFDIRLGAETEQCFSCLISPIFDSDVKICHLMPFYVIFCHKMILTFYVTSYNNVGIDTSCQKLVGGHIKIVDRQTDRPP